MTISLSVTPRTANQAERSTENLPAVIYGPKQEAVPVAISRKEFTKVFEQAGESTIITIEGLTEPIEVLVQAVDFHPMRAEIVHVDLYAIERGKEITTEIPLEFVGTPAIEKSGGMVNKVMHEVTVTCRPSNLPKNIEVDVSGLAKPDDQILVEHLVVTEGVVIDHEPGEVIAVAQGVREEEPETEPEEMDISAVEVEEKGKSDVPEESAE